MSVIARGIVAEGGRRGKGKKREGAFADAEGAKSARNRGGRARVSTCRGGWVQPPSLKRGMNIVGDQESGAERRGEKSGGKVREHGENVKSRKRPGWGRARVFRSRKKRLRGGVHPDAALCAPGDGIG